MPYPQLMTVGAAGDKIVKILITNDDGINAPGLTSLLKIAGELTEDNSSVWVVAPATEKSGVGHCISLSSPVMITKIKERTFSIEGNPADCVLAGVHYVMKDNPPDLILSGVNRGNNSAENALYSGTLGAAMEGALQGFNSIALSQYLGPKNFDIENPFEAAEVFGAEVINKILAVKAQTKSDYRLFYNVNFPPCPANEVNGISATPQGYRNGSRFSVCPVSSPTTRRFLFVQGSNQQVKSAKGSDAAANIDNYISVTPMCADLTAHDVLEKLRAIE